MMFPRPIASRFVWSSIASMCIAPALTVTAFQGGDSDLVAPHAHPDGPVVWRVGGDEDSEPQQIDGFWRFGRMRIEAPLPDGYPAPTPPGAIDIKRYPTVRRAEFTSSNGSPDAGAGRAFWPLFRHIDERGIAMTSPVEMDFEEWSGEADQRPGRWTMSFLYRSADLGPTGEDGSVRVVDTAPLFVLSIGMQGPYGLAAVSKGIDLLEAWLDDQQAWVRDGETRAFNYNGPSVSRNLKWSEVQIPIRPSRRDDFSGRKSVDVANEAPLTPRDLPPAMHSSATGSPL